MPVFLILLITNINDYNLYFKSHLNLKAVNAQGEDYYEE